MAWMIAAAVGIKAFGAYQQSNAMKQQAKLQNDINKFNIKIQEFNNWKQRGFMQSSLAARQSAMMQQEGALKTQMAAQGINTSAEGSVSDLKDQNTRTTFLNNIDMENRMNEAIMSQDQKVRNMKLGAHQQYESAMTRANSTLMGGMLQAAGTGLKGIDYTGLFSDDLSLSSSSGGGGASGSNVKSSYNLLMMGE